MESLSGKQIKKACLGENFSAFLTNRGQVLTCGLDAHSGLPESLARLRRPIQVRAVICTT